MSSFVWMKFLESSPERYDRGIRMLSGGRIDDVYASIAERAAGPGARVLDIGCGTGSVSLACAARGAEVTAIDIDAGMLEVARRKPVPDAGKVTWIEVGVAEVEDRVGAQSMDAVVSCLALSEMSPEEQDYALRVALTRLVPGGRLVLADETVPEERSERLWHRLRRLPVAAVTYVLTQTTTHPVRDLAGRVREAGFVDVRESRLWSGSFVIVEGRRPREAP